MIGRNCSSARREAATFSGMAASRSRVRRALLAVLATAALAAPVASARSQDSAVPPRTERVKLSGPRFGVTYLGGSLVDSLAVEQIDVGRLITQFGWQWERQFNVGDTGPTAVSEWVLLVGGLEQGAFLPSLSWIVGLRTKNGSEFGVGPNLSAAGFALAIGAGVTRRSGSLNLPFNLSVVPSSMGTRVSLLTGFTIR
jgi:hypothetical protein